MRVPILSTRSALPVLLSLNVSQDVLNAAAAVDPRFAVLCSRWAALCGLYRGDISGLFWVTGFNLLSRCDLCVNSCLTRQVDEP